MSLGRTDTHQLARSFPRACGDEPYLNIFELNRILFSPRMRG